MTTLPTPPTLPTALAILEGTPRVLRALVYGVPEAVLLRAPSEEPGAWCVRDVLAHLLVNDPIALERFRRTPTWNRTPTSVRSCSRSPE